MLCKCATFISLPIYEEKTRIGQKGEKLWTNLTNCAYYFKMYFNTYFFVVFSKKSPDSWKKNIFQFSSRHSWFIIITFYCFMILVSSEMELKTTGRCSSTLTETECKTGPYPKSSYKWITGFTSLFSSTPSGCYVLLSTSEVYFNRAVHVKDCTSERNCLCKKGKCVLSEFVRWKRSSLNKFEQVWTSLNKFRPQIIWCFMWICTVRTD